MIDAVSHVNLGGIRTAACSRQDLIDLMLRDAPNVRRLGEPARLVFDSNGQAVSLNATDATYRAAMEEADLIHADGGIIVAASRVGKGEVIPDRSSTTDMFQESLTEAARLDVSYFLLGGTEEVNALCAEKVRQLAPGINICGRRNGYFSEAEEADVIEEINRSGADVLWVGLGKPKEQMFSCRNRNKLKVGWIVTCGGLYNFVTGHYKRAPDWMCRSGLEWAHRLASDPKRLFWRYATTSPHALWLLLSRRKSG
ncbi:WecB/TagA/CpsF family glycosyltransferase [Palleronia sp.]|uniref:WecB/TagA/CpsF family glycosyltransferase n=1 Tax=Palleronia sp. TaxID=1940284 RepID=UPI0035C7EBD8